MQNTLVKTAGLRDFILELCNLNVELHIGHAVFPNVQVNFNVEDPEYLNIFNGINNSAIGNFQILANSAFEVYYNEGEIKGIEFDHQYSIRRKKQS